MAVQENLQALLQEWQQVAEAVQVLLVVQAVIMVVLVV
tara:strand:+ start:282 stop:395 length:114 start_codon:yes stop_codon:yes gene_type:complete